jgi:hypothetical protein
MKTKRIVRYLLLAATVVTAGFVRDYIFLNLNAQIDYLQGYPFNYTHKAMLWLDSGGYSVGQIVGFKWIATVAFWLLFMGLTLLSVYVVWNSRKYFRYVIWLYVGLFLFSGISYVLGNELLNSYYGYRFARIFMGFAQSPVPIMILIPAIYLLRQQKSSH